MWHCSHPITTDTMRQFETTFHFHITPALRDFLMAHNGAITNTCVLPTSVKERRLAAILDFSAGGDAWTINRRMRKMLGSKHLVIARDKSDNFVCIHRDHHSQQIVLWNHITNSLEECKMDIPILLFQWQST